MKKNSKAKAKANTPAKVKDLKPKKNPKAGSNQGWGKWEIRAKLTTG